MFCICFFEFFFISPLAAAASRRKRPLATMVTQKYSKPQLQLFLVSGDFGILGSHLGLKRIPISASKFAGSFHAPVIIMLPSPPL